MKFMKYIIFSFIIGIVALTFYYNRETIRLKLLTVRTLGLCFKDSDLIELHYRLFHPRIEDGRSYPLLIYLHGAGQRGNDNKRQLDGLMLFLTSKKVQKKHPSFVLAPQCPENRQWLNTNFKKIPFEHYNQSEVTESDENKMIIRLIETLSNQYPIDKNKIFILGFSMGSSGTWDIITRHPNLFAAAVPISGVSDTTTAQKIKNIPVWAFHGENDSVAPVQLNMEMQETINKYGGNCRLTVFKGKGHGCSWDAINHPGLIDWLFSQQKNPEN
jgi:predicted peptidase